MEYYDPLSSTEMVQLRAKVDALSDLVLSLVNAITGEIDNEPLSGLLDEAHATFREREQEITKIESV